MVSELKRLDIDVTGLQETRWFGSEVYSVADSVVLSSGRDLPGEDGDWRRGEGVAIVMRGRALQQWRAGGSQFRAVSSRLASALFPLELGGKTVSESPHYRLLCTYFPCSAL